MGPFPHDAQKAQIDSVNIAGTEIGRASCRERV